MLPYEILALAFSYLPPEDLDVVPLVCRHWYNIANDAIWKKLFFNLYGTNEITPVKVPFSQWRRELLSRRDVLYKWRKCAKNTDKTIHSTLSDVTDIFVNFASEEACAVCYNSSQGQGVVIDLERGKIKKKLYASGPGHEATPISASDGSRFGSMHGFFDGTVSAYNLTKDFKLNSEYIQFPYQHPCAVKKIWIAKSRNFLKSGPFISTVSASHDGTIILGLNGNYHEFKPCHSPVLHIEGCTSGSYTIQDGESVLVLYGNGSVYHYVINDNNILERHIASLSVELVSTSCITGLYQCNGYCIVQTASNIYVIELEGLNITMLDLPEGAKIVAFDMDRSDAPGTKFIAAGLDSNQILVWALPPLHPVDSHFPSETKIVIVNPRKQYSLIESSQNTFSPGDTLNQQRQLQRKPLWSLPNPIGFYQQLQDTNSPQITQLAVNAAVLLIGGYNGLVICVNVLNGQTLKRVDSRLSKKVLENNIYSRNGLVPVTRILIDPNPLRLRAIILATRPAVQFFEIEKADTSKLKSDARKRRSSKRRRRDSNSLSTISRHDIEEEIQLNDEFAILDAEAEDLNSSLRENFALSDLEDQEQLDYAVMLSQQHQFHQENLVDFDEQLRLAIENSIIDTEPEESNSVQHSYLNSTLSDNRDYIGQNDEDDELQRAIRLSLDHI